MHQCSPEMPKGGQQGRQHHDGPKYYHPCPAGMQKSLHEPCHDKQEPTMFQDLCTAQGPTKCQTCANGFTLWLSHNADA